MSIISSIQGQPLEVTVICCNKLINTEWISRQDPYVCLEYGTTRFRTRTHTDGGKDPVFEEKYVFTLIEGLRELKVVVWNSNTFTSDDFIGTGKVQLQKVLSEGFDDTTWTINTNTDRYAGEVRLMLKYSRPSSSSQPAATSFAPSAPPYSPHQVPPQYLMSPPSTDSQYSMPPASYAHPPTSYPSTHYPTPSTASYAHPPPSYSPPPPSYHPAYPPSPPTYPPASASYATPYAQPPAGYPPAPYPQQHPSYYPPGSYQGAYPRPAY